MRQLKVYKNLRLILAFGAVLFMLKGHAQVVMPDQMKPGDTWGLIDVNELYGGFMQVADTVALYSIDVQFVKKGMVVIVYDVDGNELNGVDTKSFMFVPPAGTWNYVSPFDIPAANQADFVPRNSWTEVNIRPVAGVSRTDTVAVKALLFDGDTILGFSTDPSFANAADTLFPSQLAVKLYADSLVAALSQNKIEDTDDGNTYVIATEGDSIIFVNNGKTSMVLNEFGILTVDTTMIIGGDSIAYVANSGDAFASKADSAKAVTTLLAVDSMITEGGNNINFAFGTNKITRPGWTGVTGNSVNANNLEEFLQKVFFPMPAPLINSFGTPNQSSQSLDANENIVSSIGTINIPYATWIADAGITLSFDVDNRTDVASDPADELPAVAINNIKVTKGAADVGTYAIGDGTADQAGTITINAADVSINPTSTSANTFTLVVTDDYPNTNTLDVSVNMTRATQAIVNNVTISSPVFSEGTGSNTDPYLAERDGGDISFGLSYQIVPGNETVTDVIFTESAGISSMTDVTGLAVTANTTRTTESFVIANTELTNQRLGIEVDGNIYPSNATAAYSPYVKLADRGYVGYLTNAQRLDLVNQAATVAGFSNTNCLMNYQFKTTGGISLVNNIGVTGYLCFALPVSTENVGKTFTIETYDLGTWTPVTTRQEIYNITTNGATVSYYVICIDNGTSNTSDGGSVIARVIE